MRSTPRLRHRRNLVLCPHKFNEVDLSVKLLIIMQSKLSLCESHLVYGFLAVTSFAERNLVYAIGVTSFCVRTNLTRLTCRSNDVFAFAKNDVVSLRTQTPKNLLSTTKGFLVPLVGLEPTRYRYHRILSPARLPVSPQRQIINNN